LIESLLNLARLDAGQEAVKREPFDLGQVAAGCIELLQPLAAQKRLAVHIDLAPCTGVGDPDRMGQVITNLLSNAIYYNREGGQVRLSTREENGHAIVSIVDTGHGIAVEDLPHIFERFWRADKSRSRADGRTGLGLAIAKSIMEAQGGRLEVTSKVGEGSTFEAILPNSLSQTTGTAPLSADPPRGLQ
jgi:signal transduction histidine kinase